MKLMGIMLYFSWLPNWAVTSSQLHKQEWKEILKLPNSDKIEIVFEKQRRTRILTLGK